MSERAGWRSALGARSLDSTEGMQALEAFAADYGRPSLLLLLHASVPETLRPDLLHVIRLNFVPEADDPACEADVLFAPLTQPLGGGRFRIEAQVRRHALVVLRSLYRHEAHSRVQRVAGLMWRHLERLASSAGAASDAGLAEYLEVQRWVALAHLDPAAAAQAFAQALAAQATLEPVARLRLGGLAAAIELPLAAQPELIAYARGLDALEGGDEAAARHWLGRAGDEPLEIGGVTLRAGRSWVEEVVERRGVPGADRPLASAHSPAAPDRSSLTVLVLRGDECEGRASGNRLETLLSDLLATELGRRPHCQVKQLATGSATDRWGELLRELLHADLVVIGLHAARRSTWLLLGIAWGLRPSGVLAFAGPGGASDPAATAFEVHLGDRWQRCRDLAALTELCEQLLGAARATPPFVADPRTVPARAGGPPLPEQPPASRWHNPPHGCALLGFGSRPGPAGETMARRAVEQTLHRMKIDPQLLAIDDPIHDPAAGWLDRLLQPEMVAVDWSGLTTRELVLVGLRFAFDPWAVAVLGEPPGRPERGWVPPGQAMLRYPRESPADEASKLTVGLQQWRPRLNPVYAALPGLQPPLRPEANDLRSEAPSAPSAAPRQQRHKVFMSYANVYADVARPLAQALQSADIDVFSDLRLAPGDAWRERLEGWLQAADAVVAVVGPETVRREMPMAEIRVAVARGQRLIPLVVDTDDFAQLPREVQDRQAIVIGRSQRQGPRLDEALEEAVARIQSALTAIPPERSTESRRPPMMLWIRRPAPELLRYTFEDDSRVFRLDQPIQLSLVGPLLRRLDDERILDRQLVPTMRTLLLPPELRERFGAAQPAGPPWPLGLDLDEAASTLPWELLLGAPPASRPQSWLPPPLVRHFEPATVPAAQAPHALVVGDPSTAGSTVDAKAYPLLPGAAAEAQSVAEILRRGGFVVTSSIGQDARTVVGHLLDRDYRVLHLAGQSDVALRPGGGRSARLVLSQGARLGAAELLVMSRPPELLLLNVCWMGQLGDASGRQVDGEALAPQLLRAGTRCIVAPDRLVDDELARLFMESLLNLLCDGASIDVAVAAARAAVWRRSPDDLTWAAYRVWAPAGWRLERSAVGRSRAAASTSSKAVPKPSVKVPVKPPVMASPRPAPGKPLRPKKRSKTARAKP